MGAGSSHFQDDEAATLLSLSGDAAWPYDSEKWLSAFRYKVHLNTIDGNALQTELNDYCVRIGACRRG